MMSVIVTVFDVISELSGASMTESKLNWAGEVSATDEAHVASVPPPEPKHCHTHEAAQNPDVGVPLEHILATGKVANTPPFAEPQTPLTGACAACVVEVNEPDTPPTVIVVVVDVLLAAALVWRTHTV